MKEEFREIDGFPNYEVSNTGRVINVKYNREKELQIDTDGYYRVDLYNNCHRTTTRVHRLVAKAFIPKQSGKDDINHKDGNKKNNNVNNLEWCTKKENMAHAFAHGLVHMEGRKPSYGMLGKKNPNGGRQKAIRVIENKKVYKNLKICASDLNLRSKSISDCLRGRQKSHRGYHFEYI